MKDVESKIREWRKQGQPVALATVIQTWGSSPRKVGAKMAITKEGGIAGSVSGGCVEGAVIEVGQSVLAGERSRLLHFGVADETAWGVGLACGGEIDVFVEPLADEHFDLIRAAISDEDPVATATVIDGPDDLLGRKLSARGEQADPIVGSIHDSLDADVLDAIRPLLRRGRSAKVQLEAESGQGIELFIDVVPPPPVLVIVGGVHIAVALAELAHTLGYRVTVIDPRRAFGSEDRFPDVDALIQEWPQVGLAEMKLSTSTAVAVLTHDPKIDDPALMIALPSPAFYVGALGSQRTQTKRRKRLQEAGLPAGDLDRLHGPIGLDIGAQSPEEIALAVMAEIVAAKRQ
ncbi:MAG: XdhC/CoxI family protein [Anaerolineales bacterium]